MLVSLFVSFSLDPMLSAYWPDPHVPTPEQRGFVTRMLDRFNDWFDRQAERYKTVIGWALDHRWSMVVLAVVDVRRRAGAAGARHRRRRVLPGDRRLRVQHRARDAAGLEPARTRGSRRRKSPRLARAKPEVLYTYTTIGGQTGAVDEGTVYVQLKPKHERARSQEMVAAELREELARLGGVTASITTGGVRRQKQIQVQLQRTGHRASCSRLADQVLALVQEVPGAVDVGLSTNGQKPELDVQVDRGLAGSLGVTVGPGRAGAAAGVRRHRRRRLGRSVGRDARRHRAARAGGAHERAGSRVAAADGARRRRHVPTSVPLGQVAHDHVRRSARRASITSIASA